MGSRALKCFAFFLFFIFLGSGSSVEKKPPAKQIHHKKTTTHQKNQVSFTPSESFTQFDATYVPIVNPTTPTTTVTPVMSPPPPVTPTTMNPTPVTPTTTTTPTTSGGSWCVASPTASETALQVALDYACGYGGADCSAIQQGASCFNPDTTRAHASYAFNSYYQKNPVSTSCVFGGTAQLTNTDPSSGNCHYGVSTGTTTTPSTPTTTPSTTPYTTPYTTPPSISSPYAPTTGGSTVYGSEPTATPSPAASVSKSSLLYLATTSLLMSLLAANNI